MSLLLHGHGSLLRHCLHYVIGIGAIGYIINGIGHGYASLATPLISVIIGHAAIIVIAIRRYAIWSLIILSLHIIIVTIATPLAFVH